MKKLVRHWWHAGLLGLFVGVPAGIALEFARRAHNQAASEEIARQFESEGLSSPLMTDLLQPWVVPNSTAIFFVLLALIFAITVRVRRVLHSSDAA